MVRSFYYHNEAETELLWSSDEFFLHNLPSTIKSRLPKDLHIMKKRQNTVKCSEFVENISETSDTDLENE